jgi:5-formyltetrahydrofolate cyclo-ligase
VVAYAPIENEVDPGAVVAAAVAAGKPVYYPRRTSDGLEFFHSGPEGLAPGWSAVPEPLDGAPLSPAAGEGVVFLVPGIAFDPRGVRLGRGAGCYDRSLARHSPAARIGLAYELQVVPALPEAAWDVRMDAVVTEARVLVQ